MSDQQHTIDIDATPERVWACLFDPVAFRDWASAFCEGAYCEGDWSEGSRMRFLDPDCNGMEAVVEQRRPPTHLSLRIVGELREGQPMTPGLPDAAPMHERYTLVPLSEGGTRLQLRLEGWSEEHAAMLDGMWPKALQRLKALAESSSTF